MSLTVKIWGHRRSGNNFLKHSIKSNFNVRSANHHWPWDSYIDGQTKKYPSVFMARDGRDVMVSTYYWWKVQTGAGPYFAGRSFQDFIYGRIQISEPNWMYLGGPQDYTRHKPEPEMYSDPIGYWADYMQGWHDKLHTIKFEDLKIDGQQVLQRCGSVLHLPLKYGEIKLINKLVGHAPRKGAVGDWKNHFTEEDEKYFWQKAGEVMERYGYKR